ncbi:NPC INTRACELLULAR CHOLESTEROL TRANSPORTER 1 [Salix viminalis]|uniref:NPC INTRACELLULAR CHOLESTEROL TRANSPORTER 1 n=1 Tax=Salix viminalis TaxID=40686 RepID=A0A9Q0NL50_SALVM|nr:NPC INTRACELLULAR CHOLESTEROL TRANSPORTER 1 [Salix viminalis]
MLLNGLWPAFASKQCVSERYSQVQNSLIWILRIKESTTNEEWQEVISHYREMRKAGVQTVVDVPVFPPIFKACKKPTTGILGLVLPSPYLFYLYALPITHLTPLISNLTYARNDDALSASLVLLFSDFCAKHEKEYCAMYDICGSRSDGKVLNCPFPTSSVKPDDYFSAKIQSLCPAISGNVCCTETQFDTLRAQVQQAIPLLVGCPACLRNFLNLFCELSCSPNQSLFINVTSISEVNGNLTVDGIAYYVTNDFGERLYDSCKDVKFGTMNTRAIDFVGGGANNFKEWFAFIGQKAPPGFPGSPYEIEFKPTTP